LKPIIIHIQIIIVSILNGNIKFKFKLMDYVIFLKIGFFISFQLNCLNLG